VQRLTSCGRYDVAREMHPQAAGACAAFRLALQVGSGSRFPIILPVHSTQCRELQQQLRSVPGW
jgi:hypothetical protein